MAAKKWGRPVSIPITRLTLAPGLQGRDEEEFDNLPPDRVKTVKGIKFDARHLADVTDAVKTKQPLPRIRVIAVTPPERGPNNSKPEPTLFVVNGFYRTVAHGNAGRSTIAAEVRAGTWEDAVAEAIAANKDQLGKRRTNADKRRQVILAAKNLPKWTHGKIADQVGVSAEMVRKIRAELKAEAGEAADDEPEERESKDGRKFKKRGSAKKKPAADSWKKVPLTSFMKIEDEDIGKALDEAGVKTAGDFKAAIDKGSDLGLSKRVLAHLVEELQGFIEANTPAHVPNVNWKVLEDSFTGPLVRKIDTIAREYRAIDTPSHQDAKKLLNDLCIYVFSDWKKELESGKVK